MSQLLMYGMYGSKRLFGCTRNLSQTLSFRVVARNVNQFQKYEFTRSIAFLKVRNAVQLQFRIVEDLSSIRNSKNFCSKKPNRLSFEVDTNVRGDVMVFTYANARFFRMLSVFGIVQFFFWSHMAVVAYSGVRDLRAQSSEETSSWWSMVANFQHEHRYRIAIACIALGYVVLFFTWMYPQRTVSKLVLMKGGQMVRVTTYSHFGRTKNFTVPLNDISCKQSRLAEGVQVSLKIRSRWFYYLLDKREGKFVEPQLFDYVIGLNRSIK